MTPQQIKNERTAAEAVGLCFSLSIVLHDARACGMYPDLVDRAEKARDRVKSEWTEAAFIEAATALGQLRVIYVGPGAN